MNHNQTIHTMTETTNIYTVSEQTAMFLRAIDQADTMYGCFMDACSNLYGEAGGLAESAAFQDKYKAMAAEMRRLLFDSITDTLMMGPRNQI